MTKFLEESETMAVRMVCLDLTKAYDKVQINKMMNRFVLAGLNKGFLKWLSSFLANRVNYLKIKDILSCQLEIPSGVPQGSVLSPYLFAMFIGELSVEDSKAELIKYADDLTLIEAIPRRNEQPENLKIIMMWLNTNQLQVNMKKSSQMVFKKTASFVTQLYDDIDKVTTLTILGVTWNENLNWKDHFSRVMISTSRRLYVLRRLRAFLPKKKLFEVYVSYILSVVLYATPMFGELSADIHSKLDRLHRRAHRLICGVDCECDFVDGIQKRRIRQCLTFLSSCEHTDHPLVKLVPPPFSGKFQLQYGATSRRLNTFFYWICRVKNNL